MVDASAWAAIWSNFRARAGSTFGDLVRMLDANAAFLGRLGERVLDLNDLLAFELWQANGQGPFKVLDQTTDAAATAPGIPLVFERSFPSGISSRFRLGPMGRGWIHNYSDRLSVETDGTVVVSTDYGARRTFEPDTRGGYFSVSHETAILSSLGEGRFQLREQGGFTTAFRADGKLDYVKDTQGNRITCSYSGGLLTDLIHSSGRSLHLAYNAAQRLTQITDAYGRKTVYGYDASNEHLTSVQYYNGQRVAYAYNTGPGEATQHALRRVEYPGGEVVAHGYDAQGRLSSTNNGTPGVTTLSYGEGGEIHLRNALGGDYAR